MKAEKLFYLGGVPWRVKAEHGHRNDPLMVVELEAKSHETILIPMDLAECMQAPKPSDEIELTA